MSAGVQSEVRRGTSLSVERLVVAAWSFVLLALLVHFVLYVVYAAGAVGFPFELDYGEGIVWQQAMLIPGEQMYGDITRFPFIVFHYPPLYHLCVRMLAGLGIDPLIAGRGLSVLCTVLIGLLVAALSNDAVGHRPHPMARLIGAAIAGLTVFCYWPVICWSPLMRVDMLAIMLSLFGIWCAGRSVRHPWLLSVAVVFFVLAAYTKQTTIAAPLAVLVVSFATHRRRTLTAFGLGLVIGLIGFVTLTWITRGGFVRHLLLYNLNRFSWMSALTTVSQEWPHAIFLALAFGGVVAGWKATCDGTGLTVPASFTKRIGQDATAHLMAILTVGFFFTTCTLVTLGKSGAVLNYLIEWMCLWSVLIGVFVTWALNRQIGGDGLEGRQTVGTGRAMLDLLIPVVFVGQIVIIPTARDYFGEDAARNVQLAALVDRIRLAPRPVLSDDMVLLMKAGKPVPWEPAIFAELASTGRWDERLICNMIEARAFEFIITRGHSGDMMYDSRYTPAVDQAIRKAYPQTEDQGGRTLHFPPV